MPFSSAFFQILFGCFQASAEAGATYPSHIALHSCGQDWAPSSAPPQRTSEFLWLFCPSHECQNFAIVHTSTDNKSVTHPGKCPPPSLQPRPPFPSGPADCQISHLWLSQKSDTPWVCYTPPSLPLSPLAWTVTSKAGTSSASNEFAIATNWSLQCIWSGAHAASGLTNSFMHMHVRLLQPCVQPQR